MKPLLSLCTLIASVQASLAHFELKLMLEVTRHGQRAPDKIFDLAANPEDNFKKPMNLTHTGAKNHYSTGRTIRQMLDRIDPHFLSDSYDPSQIYVQSSCSARCIDSAISQLEGLYDHNLKWPDTDYFFNINTIECHEDMLLRMTRSMCPRLRSVRHAVASEIATQIMYDEIGFDEERSGFLEHLRQITGSEGQSIHHMYSICEYIYWTRQSGIKLKFEITDEEYRRCLIAREKGTYTEFLASEELTALPVYQLMQQLSEMAAIVRGDLDWHEAEVLNQYMDERDKFPRLIIYATHQETVAPLLGAFRNILLTDPGPASSVFFWFFEYQHEGDAPRLAVKATFSETPWDEESHRSLIFLPEQETGPAFVSIERFKEYVDGKLAHWDDIIDGHKSDIDIKCSTQPEHRASG